MAKKRPRVVSRCQIGFLDVQINGVAVLGGGTAYSRTEYADGTVEESGGLQQGTSPLAALADAIGAAGRRRERGRRKGAR